VLRTTNPQASLWETILPADLLGLPDQLATVDRLLDDPRFVAPFRKHFAPLRGRPSIPIDTYLRMMFLKHRYRLGYELLCREVADSIGWQRFCRIPLGGRVPHPTTLAKLTRRVGEPLVAQLNTALLQAAREAKVLRCHKVRADTTVVAANVAYPSDLGLLARAVGKLAATIGRVKAAGGATRTRVRDRRRAARRRVHEVTRLLRARTGDAKQVVFQVTAQVADLAEQTMADAARVVGNAHRAMRRADRGSSGRLGRVVSELETTIARTQQLVGQARQRLAGQMPEGPAGWSACTTPTPARSARAASATRWSSATRRKWSTTPAGSYSTIRSRSATRRMRRSWSRRSSGSSSAPAGCRGRWPPTVATARPVWTTSLLRWASDGWRSPGGARPAAPAARSSTLARFAGW
jgi:transposase, IS5 family